MNPKLKHYWLENVILPRIPYCYCYCYCYYYTPSDIFVQRATLTATFHVNLGQQFIYVTASICDFGTGVLYIHHKTTHHHHYSAVMREGTVSVL